RVVRVLAGPCLKLGTDRHQLVAQLEGPVRAGPVGADDADVTPLVPDPDDDGVPDLLRPPRRLRLQRLAEDHLEDRELRRTDLRLLGRALVEEHEKLRRGCVLLEALEARLDGLVFRLPGDLAVLDLLANARPEDADDADARRALLRGTDRPRPDHLG